MKRLALLAIIVFGALGNDARAARSPEAEATFSTPAIRGAIGINITDRGQRFFQERLSEVLFRQGISIEGGEFAGFKYRAEEPIRLDRLPVRLQKFHKSLSEIRDILKNWLKGFSFQDPLIQANLAGFTYEAQFSLLSLRADKKLTEENVAKTDAGGNGVAFVLEAEIPELRIEVKKLRVRDNNNPFLGVLGVDDLWTSLKDASKPLKISVPIVLEIDSSANVSIRALKVETNLDQAPFDLGFARPLKLPVIELIVNGKTMRLRRDRVENELVGQRAKLMKALQSYLHDYSERHLSTLLNDQIGKRLTTPFTEINEMNPPGANAANLLPGEKFRWGMKPDFLHIDDQFLRIGLTGYVQDPLTPSVHETVPSEDFKLPRLDLYRTDEYDVALALNSTMINRVIKLSYDRHYFDVIRLSGGESLKITQPPVFWMRTLNKHGETEVRLHIHGSQEVKGIENLVVQSPLEFEFDAVLTLQADHDGAISVLLTKVDTRTLHIDDRFIKIPLFKRKIYETVIKRLDDANKKFATEPSVLISKLPIPANVAGIPIKLKDFQADGNGYLVLYVEYKK